MDVIGTEKVPALSHWQYACTIEQRSLFQKVKWLYSTLLILFKANQLQHLPA